MPFVPIDVGAAPDDGTGDDLRTAFQKVNAGFAELVVVDTFTPSLGAASNPTVTYSERLGRYARIGRIVQIEIRLVVATISGGSGALVVRDLPIGAAAGGNAAALSIVTQNVSLPSGRTLPQAWVQSGSTEIVLACSAPGQGILTLAPSNLSTGSLILLAGTYIAA